MKLLVFIAASFLFPGTTGSKKQQLLNICQEYLPEQYAFLEAYSDESVNQMAKGDSLAEYLLELPTVIHEANHHYNGEKGPAINKTRYYFKSGDEKFEVEVFPVFPSSEINQYAPTSDKKKIFRYSTYITSNTPHLDSRVNGIFGLLEEMNAYYQSMTTSLLLFDYYKDKYGFSNPDVWVNWLGSIGSYRYSLNEFSLFISWYLQTAKAAYPDVYKRICNSAQVKTMYRFLHEQNLAMQQEYNDCLKEITDNSGNTLNVYNGAIFNKKTGRGYGLGDDRLQQTQEILNRPEHNILGVLLR